MMKATSTPASDEVRSSRHFGLIELRSTSGLILQLLPTGAVFAIRHGSTLLNQFLPGPAEEGLLRLWLRWEEDGAWHGADLIGPDAAFGRRGANSVIWRSQPRAGISVETSLDVHPERPAWRWCIQITSTKQRPFKAELILAHDLGLSDEGGVRNNEAYTSHYIDLLPVRDRRLGWVVLARQNQATGGGQHPWLGLACAQRAAAFATDGIQVFGADHRLTGKPAALTQGLPAERLQAEFAVAALQSDPIQVTRGEPATVEFVALFDPDHKDASSTDDIRRLAAELQGDWTVPDVPTIEPLRPNAGLFVHASWVHGDELSEEELARRFPGPWRHEERQAGTLQSFFYGRSAHVVCRAKEALIQRPHGHILRSGESVWLEPDHLGVTCYAAGVFAAQVYLGNTNLARFLSVSRNPLNLTRANGQRVFLRREGTWHQLGVPSAFELHPELASWWYRLGHETLIRAELACTVGAPAAVLLLEVVEGPPQEFLVTHQLALGVNEFDQGGRLVHDAANQLLVCEPAEESPMVRPMPGIMFALASLSPSEAVTLGGDGPLYPDQHDRNGPYATALFPSTRRCGLILAAAQGVDELRAAVRTARAEAHSGARWLAAPAAPPAAPLRLRARDPAVSRISEVLPWFTHNAWIHFSAPHGLEQAGGAAWGVRDVCQGSIEWLLAGGDFSTARRLLLTVFSRQFSDGSWPQWFMHDPFRWIQSHHSHGDVCFWPLKALGDYIEASNDTAILDARCRYASVETAEATGPEETLLQHAERILAHARSRFVPGTALVNYGDGDWDDTLQPADPRMRTRMISAWTVALAYHTFRIFNRVAVSVGARTLQQRLESMLAQMRQDFVAHLMPDEIVAGFLVREEAGERVLLHPKDEVTGIRYRLLPMTRSILAELFTSEEAEQHLRLVTRELLYPDGARLMSSPARYEGGLERLFKRGDTAANVGREIGLQYVHAHLRYAEALAKVGDADGLWHALQVVNPVAIREAVPNAEARQANVYFSSSDAAFPDRLVAAKRWKDLRTGRVPVRGGWRLYSSGPGLFLHKVRTCLLGVRESFGDIVFDPVLCRSLDGLEADLRLEGAEVTLRFSVQHGAHTPRALRINGISVDATRREPNPYRDGGLLVPRDTLRRQFRPGSNLIEIGL